MPHGAVMITDAQRQKLIRKNFLGIRGGTHGHWVWHHSSAPIPFTERSGHHDHVFVINGSMIATSGYEGEHRHGFDHETLQVSNNLSEHMHEVVINGTIVQTAAGEGKHTHGKGVKDDDGDIRIGMEGDGDGEHRHTVVVDGVTFESITSQDVLSVETRKRLQFDVQSVRLAKDRFQGYEGAAGWAEEQGFLLSNFEELTDHFAFHQSPRHQFNEMSLQTIRISEGVEAVIGIRTEDGPVLPNHGTMELSNGSSDAREELAAFDQLQTLLTSGYDVLTDEQSSQLAHLKDEFAAQVVALRHAVTSVFPVVMQFVEGLLDGPRSSDVFAAMLDRVGVNMSLLDETLAKLELPKFTVKIEKGLLEEVQKGGEAGAKLALGIALDCLAPVRELFEDTSFERLSLLLKSSELTFQKFVDEHLSTAHMVPTAEMTRDELRTIHKQRAERFGIALVEGSSLRFPANFPTELSEYGDPVNLKFPIDTEARARSARMHFKRFASSLYADEQSKKSVHSKIVSRILDFGGEVAINPNDPFDKLLPQALLDQANVVEEGEVKKWFVPIVKQSDEERTAFGIVLEPDVTDLHGDTYDATAVVQAAHNFMANFQNIGLNHELFINDKVHILESFVAPTDMTIETPRGPVTIRKSTWMMKVRILDDELWSQVKSGDLTGFSIGALAHTEMLEASSDN